MKKETLEEMQKRHAKELAKFRELCQHKTFIVLKACEHLRTGYRPFTSGIDQADPSVLGPDRHFDAVLIKCVDCGTPMVEIDHHGVHVYVQPHSMSKGLVIPPDPFNRKG